MDTLQQELSRLSATLKEDLAHPTSDSVVRVAAAHNALRALPPAPASELRAECLLDVAHYFYVSGLRLVEVVVGL